MTVDTVTKTTSIRPETFAAIGAVALLVGIGGWLYSSSGQPPGCELTIATLNLNRNLIELNVLTARAAETDYAKAHAINLGRQNFESRATMLAEARQMKCRIDYASETMQLDMFRISLGGSW